MEYNGRRISKSDVLVMEHPTFPQFLIMLAWALCLHSFFVDWLKTPIQKPQLPASGLTPVNRELVDFLKKQL